MYCTYASLFNTRHVTKPNMLCVVGTAATCTVLIKPLTHTYHRFTPTSNENVRASECMGEMCTTVHGKETFHVQASSGDVRRNANDMM